MPRETVQQAPFIVLRNWYGLQHHSIEWFDNERTAKEDAAHKLQRFSVSIPVAMMGPREANRRRLLALEVGRNNGA